MPALFNPISQTYQDVDQATYDRLSRPGSNRDIVNPIDGRTYSVSADQYRRLARPGRTIPDNPSIEPNTDTDDGDVQWSDYAVQIMRGGAGIAQGVGWLARQLGSNEIGGAIETLGSDAVDYWTEQLSDEARTELSREFVRKDPVTGEYEWGDASLSTVGLLGAESLLGTASGAGSGAGLTKVLQVFANPVGRGELQRAVQRGAKALVKLSAGATGAEADALLNTIRVAKAAAKKLQTVNSVIGAGAFGIGEGTVGGMMSGVSVEDVVRSKSHDELLNSERYRQVYDSVKPGEMTEEARRAYALDTVASEAATLAGFQSGLTTAILGAPMGAFFGRLLGRAGAPKAITEGTGRLSAAAIGAAGEAAQEAAQSGAETIITNETLRNAINDDRDLFDGILNAMVGGAAAGAGMGGLLGAATGAPGAAGGESNQADIADRMKPLRDAAVAAAEAGVPQADVLEVVAAVERGESPVVALRRIQEMMAAASQAETRGTRETEERGTEGEVSDEAERERAVPVQSVRDEAQSVSGQTGVSGEPVQGMSRSVDAGIPEEVGGPSGEAEASGTAGGAGGVEPGGDRLVAVPGMRERGFANASPGLQSATGGGVAVPGLPSTSALSGQDRGRRASEVGEGGQLALLSRPARTYPMAPRDEWYADADYEARGASITEMTPDEFLGMAAPLEIDEESRENIDDLKARMGAGLPMDPLALYSDSGRARDSDGRHRANAAKELGMATVPVIDFRGARQPLLSRRKQQALSWRDSRGPITDGEKLIARDQPMPHGIPPALTMTGTGAKPVHPITQDFNAKNAEKNLANLDAAFEKHPEPLASEEAWSAFAQDTYGGEAIPAPPVAAMEKANNPQVIVDELQQLTPEQIAAADAGLQTAAKIRELYRSGQAGPEVTGELLLWGLLSRRASAAAQEGAFLTVHEAVQPYVQAAAEGRFDAAMRAEFEKAMASALDLSVTRQAISNLNDAGKLLEKMSGKDPAMARLHKLMASEASGPEIRREFNKLVEKPGIDNKVLSFILLVSGREDVLVLDRIQMRNQWDDGRYKGFNLYDGFKKEAATAGKDPSRQGLAKLASGARGLMMHEVLERSLTDSVAQAYAQMGREGSLGRYHWESWLAGSDQVTSHSSLDAIAERDPMGKSVTEGRTKLWTVGSEYRATPEGMRIVYPTSDGTEYFFTQEEHTALLNYIKKPANGIIPRVDERVPVPFKNRTFRPANQGRPWYEQPEIDRGKLDAAIVRFGSASPAGEPSAADAGRRAAAGGRGGVVLSRSGAALSTAPATSGSGGIPTPTIESIQTLVGPMNRELEGVLRLTVAPDTSGYDVPADAEGAYYEGTGQVVLFGNNLGDSKRLQEVAVHEIFGHMAMERIPEYQAVLAAVPGLIETDEKIAGIAEGVRETHDNPDDTTLAKEVVAVLAERSGVRPPPLLQRAVNATRAILRRLGVGLSYSEAEIRGLIARAATDLHFEAAMTRRLDSLEASERARLADGRSADRDVLSGLDRATGAQAGQNRPVDLDASIHQGAPAPPAATPLLSRPRARGDDRTEAILARRLSPPEEDVSFKDRLRRRVDAVTDWDATSVKQGMIDSAASVEALERGLFGGALDASESAHKAVLATKNLSSVMAAVMKAGVPEHVDGAFQPVAGRKGFLEIFEPLTTHPDGNLLHLWEGWAAANRASRLYREGRERNFTLDEIRHLQGLEEQYPVFRTVLNDWAEFNGQMLDLAEQMGVLDGSMRSAWENNDYVPFYRALQEVEAGPEGPGTRRSLSGQSARIMRLQGGEAPIGNVLENMILNTAHLMDASFKNRALRRVVDLGTATGDIEAVPLAVEAINVSDETMARALDAAGLVVLAPRYDQNGNVTEWLPTLSAEQKENWSKIFRRVAPKGRDIVTLYEDGKPRYYRVNDPLLLRTINNMGADAFGSMMSLFRVPKRVLTAAVTIDPAFMVANWIRDTLSTWVTTDAKMLPLGAAAKGFAAQLKDDPDALAIMMAGAGGGGFYDSNPDDVRRLLTRKMSEQQATNFMKTILSPSRMYRAYMRVGNAAEQANRIAVYKSIRRNGGSVAEAAYQAQDVLNFTMSGDHAIMQFLVQSVPFMNARIQGLYRLYRGAKDHPLGFAAKGMSLMAATLGLALRNNDREEYDELPEWDKDTYWHLYLNENGENAGPYTHWRIPKPFEVGAMFATIPERMVRLARGDDDLELVGNRFAQMVLDTFAFNPTPQLVKPIVEQYANRSMFTGSPIVNFFEEQLDPEAQYGHYTSATVRELAEMFPELNALKWVRSPKRLEALIRGYGGTLGLYAMAAADHVTRPLAGYPPETAPTLYQAPVVSRFLRDPTPKTSKYSDLMYEMMNEANAAFSTINRYRDQGRPEDANALLNESRDKLRVRARLNRLTRNASKLNDQIKRIEFDRNMDPETKRERIDAITRRRIELMRQVEPFEDIF